MRAPMQRGLGVSTFSGTRDGCTRNRPEERWAELGKLGLARLGLGLRKKRTGPRPVSQRAAGIGGQRRRRGWGRRFSPLDAATTAGMDAGDSSGRCRCFAVVDRDLTGA
ncbi:hypothetical protein CRG98_028481 [Punica granatum]|uniref:Uncharacterized protein n=1 Tax=Punica granatum TaxID=22663 RepID=A0A2I0J4H5_PUNGR|nr:hypothetical protein CRG98_028481 [Punica granatum]